MPPPNTPFASRRSSTAITPVESPQATEADQHLRAPTERTPVDLRSLDYVSSVDENLVCPVCRVAFINPITTHCDHVFCRDCFDHSYTISKTCPIDRLPLILPHDIGPTHRLILNQLDGLEVRCPNTADGCEKILARSMVQNHVDKYCSHSLVNCSEITCHGLVARKDLSRGCLHWESTCPDCEETLEEVHMERHRESECTERKTTCEKCMAEILRYHAREHEDECEEADAPCRWTMYGCSHHSKRKDLGDHASECTFKIMGPVVEALKTELASLRSDFQTLSEKEKAKDRRLKFLESDRSITSSSSSALGYPVPDMSELPNYSSSSMEYAPHDSRDQYLLSLLESQESRVDQISVGMTELEAKQTMMLFNETIPIKEQMAELRSAQGVIGMHVRWLMNFRLQERRPAAGAGPSNEPRPGSGAAGPDLASMRRSSDTARDLVTKL
jgi:TNF receptor-associated factor 5